MDTKNYAARHYTNPTGNSGEFLKDISRIKYIQRYINNRYKNNKIQTGQIVNELTIVLNLFSLTALIELLSRKIKEEFHKEVWTYLIYMKKISPIEYEHNQNLLERIPYEHRRFKGF